jgi:hypothetical protein
MLKVPREGRWDTRVPRLASARRSARHDLFCGARWNRTTDLSIISASPAQKGCGASRTQHIASRKSAEVGIRRSPRSGGPSTGFRLITLAIHRAIARARRFRAVCGRSCRLDRVPGRTRPFTPVPPTIPRTRHLPLPVSLKCCSGMGYATRGTPRARACGLTSIARPGAPDAGCPVPLCPPVTRKAPGHEGSSRSDPGGDRDPAAVLALPTRTSSESGQSAARRRSAQDLLGGAVELGPDGLVCKPRHGRRAH